MVVLSGAVELAPMVSPGMVVTMSGARQPGYPAGFAVAGCPHLSADAVVDAVAEVSLAQVGVDARTDNVVAVYGVGATTIELQRGTGGIQPFLRFTCFGGEPLGVRYRVTLLTPA